jgi:hypothetical protein
MCLHSSEIAGIGNDLSSKGFEANCVKSVVSDLMHEASQSATQLVGAQAYKLNHIAGRGIVDSRPFQIFEGSNDILYNQISENVLKLMKKDKETNLYMFLKDFRYTSKSVSMARKILDFKLEENLTQRKMVELGQALGRIMASDLVINLGEKGFHKQLIKNSLEVLNQEIASIICNFKYPHQPSPIKDYQDNSRWLDFFSSQSGISK